MAPYVNLDAPDGLVTIGDLRRATGLSREALRTAIDDGLVTPTDVRRGPGQGGGFTLTLDDALFLVACAAVAFAAGVAFVTIVKAARATGATIDPAAGGLVFPLP